MRQTILKFFLYILYCTVIYSFSAAGTAQLPFLYEKAKLKGAEVKNNISAIKNQN
jgi:hypothetical protein